MTSQIYDSNVIYIATSNYYLEKSIYKIGYTTYCYGRVNALNTSNPSFKDSIADIFIIYKFNLSIDKEEENLLIICEKLIHQEFKKYRYKRDDRTSEWFDFKDFKETNLKEVIVKITELLKYKECFNNIEGPFTLETSLNEYKKNTKTIVVDAFQLVRKEHIYSIKKRIEKLNNIFQNKLIKDVFEYFKYIENKAGYFISPCGSGKTLMSIKILNHFPNFNKIIILAPRRAIIEQWIDTINNNLELKGYKIFYCGSKYIKTKSKEFGNIENTTDIKILKQWILKNEKFILFCSYMSSFKLRKIIIEIKKEFSDFYIDFAIFDEAHHMVGYIYIDDEEKDEDEEDDKQDEENDKQDEEDDKQDEEEVEEEDDAKKITKKSQYGKSRALFNLEYIKQKLSITATPRIINKNNKILNGYFSMDDELCFGKKLHEIKMRTLIDEGIMPDYKIIITHSDDYGNNDIEEKGNVIVNNILQKNPEYKEDNFNTYKSNIFNNKYILNKLIIFMDTNESVTKITSYLKVKLKDEKINIFAIDSKTSSIDYENAMNDINNIMTRTIIINCKMLNEGVDIPIADSVSICYIKHSRVEIVQMIFRAGRWTPTKFFFYILLVLTKDEDYSSIEDVLASLALNDDALMEEIKCIANTQKLKKNEEDEEDEEDKKDEEYKEDKEDKDEKYDISVIDNPTKTKRIYIDTINSSDIEKLHNTFKKIRDIQNLKYKNGISFNQAKFIINNTEPKINSKKDYYNLIKNDLRLPEYPDEEFKGSFINWIDYLSIERKYYEIDICKNKINEYLKIYDDLKKYYLDLEQISEKLSNIDPMFPPYDLWVDYYKEQLQNLIIIKKNVYKKSKGLIL